MESRTSGSTTKNFPPLVTANKFSSLSIMPRFYIIKSECDSWPKHFLGSHPISENSVVLADFFSLKPQFRHCPQSFGGCRRNFNLAPVCVTWEKFPADLSHSLPLLTHAKASKIVIINQKTTACQPVKSAQHFFSVPH